MFGDTRSVSMYCLLMNEYDEAPENALDAVERAKERSREVEAHGAEAKIKTDHRAEALRAQERNSPWRTYGVSLVSKDSSQAVDAFYKYRGGQLPEFGEIIEVVRFLRSRPIRARVTQVDAGFDPPITAIEID
jgi:hypothetical protein